MRDWYSSANIDDRSLVALTKEFGAQTKGATVPRRRSLTSTGAVRTFLRLAYGTHLAQVAELVDALVSGTSGAIRGGSSPLLGTNYTLKPQNRPTGRSNSETRHRFWLARGRV